MRKLKLIYPSTSQHYNNCSAPTFLILFKKFLAPAPFKKEGRDYAFYMREYKVEAIKLLAFYYDIYYYLAFYYYLPNCKVKTFKEN